MWLYATGKHSKQIFLYEYQPSRSSKHPKNFLKGFKEFLQTNGYAGYNSIEEIVQVGCLAHARRGITDALKALPKDSTTSKTNAKDSLDFCNQLFKIEKSLKDLDPKEIYEKRLEKSKSVLEAFLSWLKTKEKQVLTKSTLGKAIRYYLKQWAIFVKIKKLT